MRVLLIEDDQMIGEAIQMALTDADYAIDWVMTGEDATMSMKLQNYQLILLDLTLPQMDGLEVLRQLKLNQVKAGVVIISARESLNDKISGLDLGADDYLAKPFHIHELLARMRAVIRRNEGVAHPILSNGVIQLDPIYKHATYKTQTCVLTGKEYALLEALLIRPGAILSRQELEERLYGWGNEVQSNAIEFIIHSLRKKFDNKMITNIRGVGWQVQKEPPLH